MTLANGSFSKSCNVLSLSTFFCDSNFFLCPLSLIFIDKLLDQTIDKFCHWLFFSNYLDISFDEFCHWLFLSTYLDISFDKFRRSTFLVIVKIDKICLWHLVSCNRHFVPTKTTFSVKRHLVSDYSFRLNDFLGSNNDTVSR